MAGAGGVGKTSLTVRFCADQWVEHYDPTVEDCYTRTLDDGVVLTVNDMGACEPDVPRLVFANSDSVIVVYSVLEAASFEAALEIIATAQASGKPVVLCGNKCDRDPDRAVAQKTAEVEAKRLGVRYIETSARENVNVMALFRAIANELSNAQKSSIVAQARPKCVTS
eukprot:a682858_23.p1 GENE.a682858_23~~a682858_23.p1  ORF type:complete len:197 (-),score=39.81 a682858_23:216-719(-)